MNYNFPKRIREDTFHLLRARTNSHEMTKPITNEATIMAVVFEVKSNNPFMMNGINRIWVVYMPKDICPSRTNGLFAGASAFSSCGETPNNTYTAIRAVTNL